MRIYSNILLSWPTPIHVAQAARLYPGQWQNYNLYKIMKTRPLKIQTHSPIEHLEQDYHYYSYDKYNRDKSLEELGNTLEICSVYNKKNKMYEECSVYIPKTSQINDIIVIRNNIINDTPTNYNSYPTNYTLTILS